MKRILAVPAALVLALAAFSGPASAAGEVEVTGTVTANGEPVANAPVYADGIGQVGVTDAEGNIVSDDRAIPAGPRTFRADFSTSRTEPTDDESIGNYVETPNLLAVPLEATVADGAVDLDLTMTTGGILEGSIKTPAGVPFSTRLKMYVKRAGTSTQTAALYEAGKYRIPGLTAGTYTLTSWWCEQQSTGNTVCVDKTLGSATVEVGDTTTYDLSTLLIYKGRTHPAISGTLKAGRTLRVDPDWVVNPTLRKYRWFRDGVPIGGATARRYQLKKKDIGHRLTGRTTGYGDFFQTRSLTSRPTAKIKK